MINSQNIHIYVIKAIEII